MEKGKRETPKPITIEFQPFSLMEFSLFFASSTFHLGKDKLVNKTKKAGGGHSSMMSLTIHSLDLK